MEEVWKSRLSRTPLSERQRISSGEVCWESIGEGEEEESVRQNSFTGIQTVE